MGIPGLPRSAPPLDLAAMEERLKRFDAEREATNTWLKANFPELAEVLKAPPPPLVPAAEGKGKTSGAGSLGAPTEDVYERVPNGYHQRGDAMQRALANEDCDVSGGIPAVGRPSSQPRGHKVGGEDKERGGGVHGGGGPQRKLRSFAEALEQEGERDKKILDMMADGFAENDLIDHLRDASAKASATSFERGFQDREHMYQYERDNQRRAVDRQIQEEAQRQKDDLARTRADDEARRARDDADRQRRDVEDASRRQRELDAANARRDAERRDQEYRDQQRRLEEDRLRADRDRS